MAASCSHVSPANCRSICRQVAESAVRVIDRNAIGFTVFDESWALLPAGCGTTLPYDLTARPDFGVPEFIIRRRLKRNASGMLARMPVESAASGQ